MKDQKTVSDAQNSIPSFQFPIRVYYEDTDAGGVVYHSNYINFFERTRTEWLRALGFEQDTLVSEYQTLFLVRALDCEYLRPAKFNDELLSTVDIKALSRTIITFDQAILRASENHVAENKGSELLAKGSVKVVAVDANTFKPKRLPKFLLEKLPPIKG